MDVTSLHIGISINPINARLAAAIPPQSMSPPSTTCPWIGQDEKPMSKQTLLRDSISLSVSGGTCAVNFFQVMQQRRRPDPHRVSTGMFFRFMMTLTMLPLFKRNTRNALWAQIWQQFYVIHDCI